MKTEKKHADMDFCLTFLITLNVDNILSFEVKCRSKLFNDISEYYGY